MSERIKPYGGSSRNRLTKLINSANATALVEGIDFEYGEPIEDLRQNTNTRISILPLRPGHRIQQVNYRRLNINALQALPPNIISKVNVRSWPFSIHENLEEINEALGLNLVPEEVHDDVYYDEGQITLYLRITEASHAWLPGSYPFKISTTVPLDEVWPVRILIGLNAPAKNA